MKWPAAVLYFLCFLNMAGDLSNQPHSTGDISVNCGSTGCLSARHRGWAWHGDLQPQSSSSLLLIHGLSTASRTIDKLSSNIDPCPYRSARLSRSRFSYTFPRVSRGPKIIRLHFHPAAYKGFRRFEDLFSVEAGGFTLLGNFSASLAAQFLGVASFVKEYCIKIGENRNLNITFSPASSSPGTYAFVNGIEIVSVPEALNLSYFHREEEDVGVQAVGESRVYIGSSTAIEIVRRVNINQGPVGDFFGMQETVSKQQKVSSVETMEWRVSVDVGFRYLVRLHFSQLGFKTAEINSGIIFHINEVVLNIINIGHSRWFRDYLVMMNGNKQLGKRDVLIHLRPHNDFLDGFEIMKLSNPDNSLASPNPLPYVQDSSCMTIQYLARILGLKNSVATVAVLSLALANISVHAFRLLWEASSTRKVNQLSARAKRHCRRFSFSELQSATGNFSNAHLIGRGGFGMVYKGFIDKGRKAVAVKRQKANSSQGVREFLTEIESLTELRHFNLVSLIGYCDQRGEMILVYEFMAGGTLSDYLYKFARNGDNRRPLTWKQRLNICIGSGRGLDYLHTGHSLIHRDVKASNILLDENLVAKVSDFGLAKHLSRTKLESHVITKVKGTYGYLDPSYRHTGKLTKKSDTYSFGVVLLEVLSGRPATFSNLLEDERFLIRWARQNISNGKPEEIVDQNLIGEITKDSLMAFVDIAKRCLDDEPRKRPTMARLVLQLEFALEEQERSKSLVPPANQNSHALRHASPKSSLIMPDAAVEFLLENVMDLLLNKGKLIRGSKREIETLWMNLQFFTTFLKDSTKKQRKDFRVQELIRQIRDVVYEAHDVIDAFVTVEMDIKSKKNNWGAFVTMEMDIKSKNNKWEALCTVVKDVESVGRRVMGSFGDKSIIEYCTTTVGGGEREKLKAPIYRQVNMVGFKDEQEKIIEYLNEETQHMDVISIIGMAGLGKTTLARKVFEDPAIQFVFPTRIWINISQESTKKDVFLAILKELIRITETIYDESDWELAQRVADHLERQKFLIVMDDVRTPDDWEKLLIALPKDNRMGKVLMTSRRQNVALYANRDRLPQRMRFLTPDESWLLLKLEVFGKPECCLEIEDTGKLIARQCRGLPLALVVIGGILARSFSSSDEMSVKRRAWEKVLDYVQREEDPEKCIARIIALGYDKLPHHLKACFLYFVMFPEVYEIPAWKLVCMWIAEGFIQHEAVCRSLEETALSYLDELIDRNLVRVDKWKSDGSVNTCRVPGRLREFCKIVAGNENFLREVKKSSEGGFDPPVRDVMEHRRLCIHSDDVLSFVSSELFGPRIRSFACFSEEYITLPAQSASEIFTAFRLLRVLEAKPMKFTKIPSELYQLFHLTYISLFFDSAVLPSSFSKLLNLQTLVVQTTSRTLDIKANIWKMIRLRHIKTNAITSLPTPTPTPKTAGREGENLQTLGFISPESCTEEIFNQARNLKKLGIRGHLALLLEAKVGSFKSLATMKGLKKLKLMNDVFPTQLAKMEYLLRFLPRNYEFPPKLRSLTLSYTMLDWAYMSDLGRLDNLEVLKLEDGAFKGEYWEMVGWFPCLEVLSIGRTDLVVWKALGHHHFPRLRQLKLMNCEQLAGIPSGLADAPSLQLLDLYRCSSAAAWSAQRIHDVISKRQEGQSQTTRAAEFKLSIFPPLGS